MTRIKEAYHKSTTHPERFYHFTTGPVRGTVFMREEEALFTIRTFHNGVEFVTRKECVIEGGWRGSAAVVSENDQFDRKRGRTIARRRYFTTPYTHYEQEHPELTRDNIPCSPTYDSAEAVLRAYAKRFGKLD